MSEDLFDKIIEYVGEMKDDEKMCEIPLIQKQPSEQQYKLIQDYFDKDNGCNRREGLDELWTYLATKLNDIGPPAYSNVEWRRKWAVHNTKKLTSSKRSEHKNRQGAAAQSKGTNGANSRNIRVDSEADASNLDERQGAACTSGSYTRSNETADTFTQSNETADTFTQPNETIDSDPESIYEEFLDEYIEYENLDADADKENQPNNTGTIKKPRVSKQQYAEMDRFHKEHSKALAEGAIYNKLWKDLALKLNDMGPCVQSVQEWKRKWALRKYYHKNRKNGPSNTEVLLDKPSHSDESNQYVSGHSSSFENEVLQKLDQILNKLDELIEVMRTQSAPSAPENE